MTGVQTCALPISQRAKFVRTEPAVGDKMDKLEVNLDKVQRNGYYIIDNHNLPLDTLWHGKTDALVEYSATRPNYTTVSLVRDTKKINVTLRELNDPTTMDVTAYSATIHSMRLIR